MRKNNTIKAEKPEIAVRIHVPEYVPDRIRQDKINRLYDLLKPKETGSEKEKNIA